MAKLCSLLNQHLFLVLAMFAICTSESAGEEVQNSSTLKIGRFTLNLEGSLNMEFNSNINATSIDPIEDIVLTPELGIAVAWPISNSNKLSFRSTIGYSKYLNNPQFDRPSLTLSPDSALSFRLHVGEVLIEFHDSFALTSDTSTEAALSGVVSLPRFENTIGFAIIFDLNQAVVSLGYDHYNFLVVGSAASGDGTESKDLSSLNYRTERVSASAVLSVGPAVRLGVQASAADTRYQDAVTNNYATFSVGPSIQYQLTRFTELQATFGLVGYSTKAGESLSVTQITAQPDGSFAAQTVNVPGREGGVDLGSYASLAIGNRLNRYYTQSISIGHEDRSDPFSGRTQTNSASYASNWALGRRISLGLNLFVQDIKSVEGGGVGVAGASDYRRFGGAITAVYAISDRFNVGLSFSFIKQESDTPSAAYDQNRASVRVGYRF